MATIADISTLANATAAAHGYVYTTYQKTIQGQVTNVVGLEKDLNPASKTSVRLSGYGESASLTTAKTNALASLNAVRRQRYAGSPGLPSGATITADLHGDTPVADAS